MDPKVNPTSDSLISGFNTPVQAGPAVADPDPRVASAYPPQQPGTQTPVGVQFPEAPVPAPSYSPDFSSGATAEPPVAPTFQTPQNQTPSQEIQSPFQQPDTSINPAISLPQQPAVQTNQAGGLVSSSLDPPPSPPSQPQQFQSQIDLNNAVVQEKPKKKIPVFLLVLLLLVVAVIGAVGFLAFQNSKLNKNALVPVSGVPTQVPLQEPPSVDPYSGYRKFVSTILPMEFMIPSSWTIEETQDENLGNQKLIKSNSPDFSYGENNILAGFEFRIGPVTDLSKKYSTFDAFAAEENVDNLSATKTINSNLWLVKGTEAKTLIDGTPVTIAVYSNASQISQASEIFDKILNSIKISATPTGSPTLPPATPSASVPE